MRFPKITSPAVFVLFLLSAGWLVLVIVSPLLVPANTLRNLSGTVGTHDNEDQFANLTSIPKAIYWIGDGECHQIADRSYFINGNQMPFCARDLGLFVGLAFGFGLVSFYRYKIHPLYVLLGLVPLGIDGGLQLVTDYESNNPLRLGTGIVAGLSLSLLLAHFLFALQEERKRPAEKGKPGQP
jgi:uncharacterized membrane protein